MKLQLTLIIIVLFLLSAIYMLIAKNNALSTQLSDAQNNIKTVLLDCENLRGNTQSLKLTVDQLEYANDSISKELVKTIQDNKLKSKDIKQLQYILNSSSKVDTILVKDTIFVNNTNLDTTISDQWYDLKLRLQYPNRIVVKPKFTDEIVTIFSYKKETINPPKKCFIARWFQKKHIVTEIQVINNNPYSTVDTTRFIEIVNY